MVKMMLYQEVENLLACLLLSFSQVQVKSNSQEQQKNSFKRLASTASCRFLCVVFPLLALLTT